MKSLEPLLSVFWLPYFIFFLNGRAGTRLSEYSPLSTKVSGSIQKLCILKPDFQRFLIAKATSMGLILLLMVTFFYTYSGMFGAESLIVDIIFTFVLTIIAFMVSYKIYLSKRGSGQYFLPALILFFAVLAMELLFTAFPPHIPLFQDSVTGVFGFPV